MSWRFTRPARWRTVAFAVLFSTVSVMAIPSARGQAAGQSDPGRFTPPVKFTGNGDHRNMMEQLGIRALRPGANPNAQSTFDEATANRYALPELMVMKNGYRWDAIDPQPAWYDSFTFDDSTWQPYSRNTIYFWRSTDCGARAQSPTPQSRGC